MSSITKTRILAAAVCLLAISLTGCQLFSWAVVAFVPERKTPALYTFDDDLRVLVFPDSPHCTLEFPTILDQLADKLSRELTDHDIVAETVPLAALRVHQDQMDRDFRMSEGRPAPLDAVASKVGADAVLYIDIRQFQLRSAPGQPVWSGKFSVMVRVVDADGRRLWPPMDQAEGHAVSVHMTPTANDSTTYGLTLTEKLADRMAERIAKLFYKHRAAS